MTMPGTPVASIVTPPASLIVMADPLELVVSEIVCPASKGSKTMVSGPAIAAASASTCRREPVPESALVVTVKVAACSAGESTTLAMATMSLVFMACEEQRGWMNRGRCYFFPSKKSAGSTPSSFTITGVQVPDWMTDIVPRKVFPASSLYFARYSGPG